MQPLPDLDDILHGSHEGGIGVQWDHLLVVQVDDLARQHLQRPSGIAFGGVEHASSISLASLAPSNMRGLAKFG